MSSVEQGALGRPDERVESWDKVAGRALYAYEQPFPALYVHPVLSTVARGRVAGLDTGRAQVAAGVEAVLTYENAERLADTSDAEFAVLQGPGIGFCGQIVAAVVARTPEEARRGAALVRVDEHAEEHDVVLGPGHPRLYRPHELNAYPEADTQQGDPDAALEQAPVVLDRTYRTPMEHNNPMEPHACTALWEQGPEGGSLRVYDSTQGVHPVRETLAQVLGLEREQVRVVSEHVGGGFGSKGSPHAHNVLAALAARAVPGRWVKLALTRQQMFTLVGHRTPTIQRLRLGASRDGVLSAVVHDVEEHTSTVKEFAEQSAVCTRMMYAAPHRRTTHRLAALDVPIPFWMRAPGETPGVYALESALDELACELAMDPIVLRERNEPDLDPETGAPWSDRRLLQCLHEGARRFGWDRRDGRARSRREGDWWVGTGVASAVYPHFVNPGSEVEIVHEQGVYTVSIGAADIGTGARTVLGQISADALSVPAERVRVRIGDTALPPATVAGGSAGTSSWGSAVVAAARALREEHGDEPGEGARARAGTPENTVEPGYAVYSFGAHFVEAHVHADTGEVRVPRMYGLFSVGRVLNPRLARSQLVGGMVMGLSMALHEHTVMDPRLGHVVNHDLAQYHVAAHADVQRVEAEWLEGADARATPMGSRGVGEVGIVGAAAAVANAAHHATGVRVRNLPLTPDRFLVDPSV